MDGASMFCTLSAYPLNSGPSDSVSAPMSQIRKPRLRYSYNPLRAAKRPSQQVFVQAEVPNPAFTSISFPTGVWLHL